MLTLINEDHRAHALQTMSEAILTAIGQCPGNDDAPLIVAALGSALGCVARQTDDAAGCIQHATGIAQGVVSGELLEDDDGATKDATEGA